MSEINVGTLNTSDSFGLPVYTQTEIDALDVPAGSVVFNSTLNKMSFYDGSLWIVPKDAGAVPAATGGDTVTDLGGFRIHQFTNPGSSIINFTSPGNIDILIVGGGGGGGGVIGGGGGAGGYIYLPGYDVQVGTYTVTVGAGGTGGNGWNSPKQYGDAGGNSSFGSITAVGGGGGFPHGGNGPGGFAGGSGGSGGGAANDPYNGGLGGQGQYYGGGKGPGNPGGSCFNTYGGNAGAGGGGAKTKGKDVVADYVSSDGGDGFYNAITGTAIAYAGGGGGGNRSPGTAGVGGIGGGGNGTGSTTTAAAGGTNLGGGGGGGGYNGSSGSRIGGNGGPGIVVIRYFLG
jgi:hypothetical protein